MAAVQTMQMQHQPGLTSIGERQSPAFTAGFDASPSPSSGGNVLYDDVPTVVHASEQKYIKSEDVIFVRSTPPVLGDVHSVFMVCDGHMGVGAADHCVKNMPGLLKQLLPQHLPDWTNSSEVETFAEAVRRGISTAAVLLDNDWARLNDSAGTTLTMAVLSGWLLTIANTGDSNAIIDCGDDVQEITFSHRIQVNKAEQARLREAGAQLAPVGFHLQGPAKPQEMGVGPLRMWPGGLCVSRSIGDLDAGPLIVPLPHIRQVVVNRNRALRLIMASDGLWDLMSFSKAAKSVRHKLPTAAVNALVQMAVRDRRMADDVSIIIFDVLPPPTPGATPPQFPAAALKTGSTASSSGSGGSSSRGARSGGGGGLFGCFKSSAVEHEDSPTAAAAAAAKNNSAGAGIVAPPSPQQQQQQQRASMDIRGTFAGGLARLSGRGFGGVRRPGPPAKPWAGLQWFADVDCFEAYPMHSNQLARTEPRVLQQRPKTPPKRVADFTVHGGQAHRFQQDSSWHAGNSMHGVGSGELPLLLSAQQLEQLQADGPAAAASMHFTGMQQQQQQQGCISTSLYAAGGGGAGSDGSTNGTQQQQQQQRSSFQQSMPATTMLAGGSGSGRGHSQQSTPAAGLTRCASAQFEVEGSSGLYVSHGEGSGGRMVKPSTEAAINLAHFGSAPEAVAAGSGVGVVGGVEGRVHRGSLAAAAAEDSNQRLHGYDI